MIKNYTMRIIASLTTIPNRISKIEKTINALYNQTIKFDNIYLNIPFSFKGKKYIIPKFLDKYDNLKIIRCKDYGPITKIIPVLNIEKDKNTIIVTFDDDSIPSSNVLSILLRKSKKYPDCALSFSGWCIGNFPFYFEFIGNNEEDLEVDWIQGTHSILYHRKFINKKKLLTISKNKKLFKNDDHAISFYLKKNNIKRISIGYNCKEYFTSNNEISKIDAISGNFSFKFFKEVADICFYLKKINIYNISTNFYHSIIFKFFVTIIFIITLIVIFIKFK
jgi:hypothetical protein